VFRELHKKDELLAAALRYPILWDGHLARPALLAGKMPAPQEILGYFFNWKSLSIIVFLPINVVFSTIHIWCFLLMSKSSF